MPELSPRVAPFLELAGGNVYTPDEERVALATYAELAEAGVATVVAIASRAGLGPAEVDAVLAPWKAVFRDEGGDVVGFLGLTAAEMPNRISFGGPERSAWCSWDTLFLPAVVGRSAHVRAKDPVSGAVIELDVDVDASVRNLSHEGLVLSFREPPPEGLTDEVQKAFCHYVHFFESEASAQRWVEQHPGTFVMSLAEGVELARRTNSMRYPTTLGRGLRSSESCADHVRGAP